VSFHVKTEGTSSSVTTFQVVVAVFLHISVLWNDEKSKLATAFFHTSFLTHREMC